MTMKKIHNSARKLDRLVDWEQRLFQLIDSRRRHPFAWGKQDCCLFAADAVLQMTGVDLAASYRGRYHNAATALKLGAVAELIDKTGLPRMRNVNLARRGDMMLLALTQRETVGVCVGGQIAAPGVDGLVFVPVNKAIAGWRI